jgi:hypothetical protein
MRHAMVSQEYKEVYQWVTHGLVVPIVATVGSIGLVEFIIWAILVISDPSFDFPKLERRHHTQI